jgi:hypothetical protein
MYCYVATRTSRRYLAAMLLKKQLLSPLQACCYKEGPPGSLTARRAVPIELEFKRVLQL